MNSQALRDRQPSARTSEPELPAVAGLVLLSGAFMVWAGYLLALRKFATGFWLTLPPWLMIEGAFALLRRAERPAERPRLSLSARLKQEAIASLSYNRLKQEVIATFALVVIALAGYAGKTWSWLLTEPLIVLGAVAIVPALADGRSLWTWWSQRGGLDRRLDDPHAFHTRR
jgi:hypothetical protein